MARKTVKVEINEPITIDHSFVIVACHFDAGASIRDRAIDIDLRQPSPLIKDCRYGVPSQNYFSVDRPGILEKMRGELAGKANPNEIKILALKGPKGMGKTHLMRQYCSLYSKEYDFVFWLNIGDMTTMADSIRELAINLGFDAENVKHKDLEEDFNYVRTRLQEIKPLQGNESIEKKKAWLLLLDNAPKKMFKYLPRFGGDIIFTCEETSTRKAGAVVSVGEMKEEEALSLLLGVSSINSENLANADADAKAIVDKLDHMPLAINLARAYIESTQISYKAYLDLLNDLSLPHEEGTSGQHSSALATVWQLSCGHVRNLNPMAVQILEIGAFLYPESIPTNFFLKEYFSLGLISASPALPSSEIAKTSQEAVRAAIEVLTKFSMMIQTLRKPKDGDEDPGSDLLEMHRLIKEIIYNGFDSERRVQWLKRLAVALNGVTEFSESDALRARIMGAYIPHIRQFIAPYKDHDGEFGSLEELDSLLERTVSYLVCMEAYTDTEDLAKTSISVSETLNGPGHLNTTKSISNLALYYLNVGKYDEAEKLYQQARKICETKVGAEQAISLNNLADFYQNRGLYREAESLYQQALDICEETLGPHHELTAKPLFSLAVFYEKQEKFNEAEDHYRRALEIHKKLFGHGHPNTVKALNNLGFFYCKQAKFGKAEDLYKQALAISDKAMGSKHPFTHASFRALATSFVKEDRSREVKTLCELVLAIDEKGLDGLYNLHTESGFEKSLKKPIAAIWKEVGKLDNPDMAVSLNLVGAHQNRGDESNDSELEYIRKLEYCEKEFGQHLSTVTAITNLAAFYCKQGKYDEAESRYKHALDVQEKILSSDSSSMAASLYGLAELYHIQKKYDLAEPLFQRVWLAHELEFGPEHPSCPIYLDGLAALYRDWGRHDEAERFYIRALEIFEKVYGPKHRFVGVAANNLAALYHSQQNFVKAERLYQRAFEILKQSDPEHPSLKNLILLYINWGKRDAAEHLWPLTIRENEMTFKKPQFVKYLNSDNANPLKVEMSEQDNSQRDNGRSE